MKNIKTQNIPVDFQTISDKKTNSVEVSEQDFKKALQSLVEEDVSEEKEVTVTAESESDTVKPDEEVVLIDIPLNLMAKVVTPNYKEIPLNFEMEVENQKDLPQQSELVMTNLLDEKAIVNDQNDILTDVMNQSIFSVADTKIAHREILVDSETVEESNHSIPHINDITILETEATKQVKGPKHENVLSSNSLVAEEQTELSTIQTDSLSEELILQMEMKIDNKSQTAIEQPVEIEFNNQIKMTDEIEITENLLSDESTKSIDTTEKVDGVINTDISASGQLTQMKLNVAQQELQTDPVKVVSQEQLVEEIQTMIVETVEGTDQTDRITTTRIQLTPRNLGELDIEIIMKNNELTARLVVEEMETKQWLEQKLAELTSTLAEQKIKVEQFDIQVSNQSASFTESSLNEQSFFKHQKDSSKQSKGTRLTNDKEIITEHVERKVQSNTGRLSIWV